MPTALFLAALVAAAPATSSTSQKVPAGARKGPTAYDTALLYFLAGDLPRAQDWARRGLEREKAKCLPLHRRLAEYAYLFSAPDLTAQQASELVALDRAISPGVPSKLTEKVLGRFVVGPLQLARARLTAGDPAGAKAVAVQSLAVDPSSAEARALLAEIDAPDAGR